MSTIAFLFPGQGSQKVRMGADLQKADPDLFARYFDRADAVSGLPITRLCLEGPQETLTETQVAQPALFTLSLALTEAARQAGLRPDYVAGHSLGEYTAAVAAGALGFEEGLELVSLRGRLMAGAQNERPGAMAAIIGLPIEVLRDLCERASEAGLVVPANLNTPSQIVVSGEEAGVERLLALAKEAGAAKALRLQVGAGFHTALMEPVQARMAERMQTIRWSDAEVPMASNASGTLVQGADEVREALIAQIASPVLWVSCVQALVAGGCTTFLELGSGRVLSGLVRQIHSGANTAAAESPDKIAAFAREQAG